MPRGLTQDTGPTPSCWPIGSCCWHTAAWLQATSLSGLRVPTGTTKGLEEEVLCPPAVTQLRHLESGAVFSLEGAGEACADMEVSLGWSTLDHRPSQALESDPLSAAA